MRRVGALIAGFAFVLAGVRTRGAGAAPVLFQSGPGQFEVAALDSTAAAKVAAMADEAWRLLAQPLALPAGFSTPVLVRLVPAGEWREAAAERVIVEAGGVVSVRVRWPDPLPAARVRRALVEALLTRVAVAGGGGEKPAPVPRWLVEACAGWWESRAEEAQLDALKQEAARLSPPSLKELLEWRKDGEERHSLSVGAFWWLTFLQGESGRTGAWPAFLRRVLAGEEAGGALAASFPGRFGTDAERELWWQTGWQQVSRVRTLPLLGAAESRGALVELARFVFADGGRDRVVPLPMVLAHAGEPGVTAELQRRAAELNRLLPALHPFYRNAGLSLDEVFAASAAGERREALCAAFERDWRDAGELEAAAAAALDALEAGRRTP